METAPTGSMRLPSLTGLRFVAAALIFATHCANLFVFSDTTFQQNYAFVTGNLGVVGVSFFFVLSGFVLCWSARPGHTARAFWRRRLFKVFPIHVTVFAVALALLLVAGAAVPVPEALAQLFLLQAWIPVTSFYLPTVNGITWSLSAELGFYAAFPLLIVAVRRIRAARLWACALLLVAAALALPLLAQALLPGGTSLLSPSVSWPRQWFLYFFPVPRGIEFALGMVLAEIVRRGRWIGVGVLPATALIALAYAAVFALPPEFSFGALYALPVGLLVAALAAGDTTGRRTFLSGRTAGWFGDITYGFFLVHVLVLFYVHAAFSGQWGGTGYYDRVQWSTPVALLFLAGVFALCVLLARLLFRFVQEPASRRWSVARTPSRDVVAARS